MVPCKRQLAPFVICAGTSQLTALPNRNCKNSAWIVGNLTDTIRDYF